MGLILTLFAIVFFGGLACLPLAAHLDEVRRKNVVHKKALFRELDVKDAKAKRIVGYFHPYW